ncbi:unnamed protein product [Peniophora sp. CBMAI 1063]|nr:unnamed protein product [Peniophora sp. CBMAI 1063]
MTVSLTNPGPELSGILPSKANGQASDMSHGDVILDIAVSTLRALDYSQSNSPWHDPMVKQAAAEEIQSWDLGGAVSGAMKCLGTATNLAELSYPAHNFDLKVLISICIAVAIWIDNVADSLLDELSEFQRRFYSRLPQLHPILDRFAENLLKLYDHYEAHAANAMILSMCVFMDANCLEMRALSQHETAKRGAELWPYYLRSQSGIATFLSFACFPAQDHPDHMRYIQAIPEMLVFSDHINDVISFYKEEMDGEQHNYIQMMSRISGFEPLDVLRDTSQKAVSTAKRADAILADSPAALKAFKEYERGFIRYHLESARYRLPETWKVQFVN